MDGRTDGRTDGWTNTPSYRDAKPHLKTASLPLLSPWPFLSLTAIIKVIVRVPPLKWDKMVLVALDPILRLPCGPFIHFPHVSSCTLMDARTHGHIDARSHERTFARTHVRTDPRMYGRTDAGTCGCTDARMHGRMDARTNGRTDEWRHGRPDEWTHARVSQEIKE